MLKKKLTTRQCYEIEGVGTTLTAKDTLASCIFQKILTKCWASRKDATWADFLGQGHILCEWYVFHVAPFLKYVSNNIPNCFIAIFFAFDTRLARV
jgi:hypothetical protein